METKFKGPKDAEWGRAFDYTHAEWVDFEGKPQTRKAHRAILRCKREETARADTWGYLVQKVNGEWVKV